jgi:hypothetical protein
MNTTGRTASEKRKQENKMGNTHWGGVVEDNSFGTIDILSFAVAWLRYIYNGKLSGTVAEMKTMVEYSGPSTGVFANGKPLEQKTAVKGALGC